MKIYKIIYCFAITTLFIPPLLDFLGYFTHNLPLVVKTSSDLIQAWLLIAGCWMAFETYKLRALSVKQTQILVAPILVVYFRDGQRRMTVRNVGKGPAFDVKFEEINIQLEDINEEAHYSLRIADPPVLIPDEERKIIGKIELFGEPILGSDDPDGSTVWIEPKYAVANFKLSITYSDMEGTRYISQMLLGKAGVKLLNYRRQ